MYCLLLHCVAPFVISNSSDTAAYCNKLLVAAGIQHAPSSLAESPSFSAAYQTQERAELVVEFAVKHLGIPSFITPQHILDGNPRVNLIFLACLFHLVGQNSMSQVYRAVISKREAFSRFINSELKGDADLDPPPQSQPEESAASLPPPVPPPAHLLPLDAASILWKSSDAVILWYVVTCLVLIKRLITY